MTRCELISVHVPKTGGTSLRFMLIRHYGAGSVKLDYCGIKLPRDRTEIPNSEFRQIVRDYVERFRAERPLLEARCVHGHFQPSKYSHIDAPMITVLRHPVQQLLSLYFHWKRRGGEHKLANALHAGKAGLLDLARHPAFGRFYTETLFCEFDMGRFALIGRTEDMGRVLARLEADFGIKGSLARANPMPPVLAGERAAIEADRRLIARLTDLLSDDIRFYERHAGLA
jgi:hypothetical protein